MRIPLISFLWGLLLSLIGFCIFFDPFVDYVNLLEKLLEANLLPDFCNDCLSNRDLFLNLLTNTPLDPSTIQVIIQPNSNRPSVMWSNLGKFILDLYYQWVIGHKDFYSFSTPNAAYWVSPAKENLIDQLFKEIFFYIDIMNQSHSLSRLLLSLKSMIHEENFFSFLKNNHTDVHSQLISNFHGAVCVSFPHLSETVYPSFIKPGFFSKDVSSLQVLSRDQLLEISRFLTYEIWGYKNKCDMHINKETLILMKSFIDNLPNDVVQQFSFGPLHLLNSFLEYRNEEMQNIFSTPDNLKEKITFFFIDHFDIFSKTSLWNYYKVNQDTVIILNRMIP